MCYALIFEPFNFSFLPAKQRQELKSIHDMKIIPSSNTSQVSPPKENLKNGFAKVVAGGRIIRIDSQKPYLERMVTGTSSPGETVTQKAKSKELALLESITANLDAGIKFVDQQETSLAKIGGKLSEMALCLNKARCPDSDHTERTVLQEKFSQAKDAIFKESISSFDHSALFSNGPSKPLTIAVPNHGEWEGLSIERSDLGQTGLKTVMGGKVYGDGPGFNLDHGAIKRAFSEWRSLCTSNRLSWGMLVDRLHGISSLHQKILDGTPWRIPEFNSSPSYGPLRRPHRNN